MSFILFLFSYLFSTSILSLPLLFPYSYLKAILLGGEDAYFVSKNGLVLGVADGMLLFFWGGDLLSVSSFFW